MFKCNKLVTLDALQQFLMVMVGCAANKVKLCKGLALHARQYAVYLFQKVEHLQTLVAKLAVCRTATLPDRKSVV